MLAWRQIYFEWCLRVACPKKAICINSVFPLLLSMIIFRMSCFYVGRGMSYLTHVVDTRKKRLMLLCWFTTIKLNRKENASLVYIQLAAWWWQQTLWDRAWEKIRTLFCLQTAKKSIFPVLRKTRQTYTNQLTTMSMTIVAGVMWQSTLILDPMCCIIILPNHLYC